LCNREHLPEDRLLLCLLGLARREIRLEQVFDPIAESYDRWYDTFEGQSIFAAEVKCFRSLCAHLHGRWLEVGVGTGRFASILGVTRGIDLSIPMLKIATERGILPYAGLAEDLPFQEDSFDGVLMALTFCFLTDPGRALKECGRVLRPRGNLLLGVVPAYSPWGRMYERKKAEGHPVYAFARFPNIPEIVALIQNTGFTFKVAASTLFWNPKERPEKEPRVETGISSDAGFVSLLFARTNDCCERFL
jgi:ubiquinone/menaquinone biosynthesis C-methylase UbiE